MFIVTSYSIAVVLCVVTMFCWGSWANTQKLAGGKWRFELFYWDYVFGVVLCSLVFAFTLGSNGTVGRGFLADVGQADPMNLLSAAAGGVVFNLANILLVAAIAIAGMSVAFPVGIGLALVVGVAVNYVQKPVGSPVLLAAGVALIAVAIVVDAVAYRRLSQSKQKISTKGLVLSLCCGVLMGFFYLLVARPMASDFTNMEIGKLGPYTAVVFFSLGILVSNFVFNSFIMAKPVEGPPVGCRDYLAGSAGVHLCGILGGVIWGIGMMLSIIASDKAGPAISYGLGQGATMVAALWGVFVWREFRAAPEGTNKLLTVMFLAFLAGLAVLIYARLQEQPPAETVALLQTAAEQIRCLLPR